MVRHVSCVSWCVLFLAFGCSPPLACGDLVEDERTGRCVCPDGGTAVDGRCVSDGGVDAAPADSSVSSVPDACASMFYADDDGDGFGDPAVGVVACEAPTGHVADDRDCDDDCATCNPDGTEVCGGGADEDCDGAIDEECGCTTGDTQACGDTDVGECAFGTQRCVAGAWGPCEGAVTAVAETCNSLDDDCDGDIDEDVETRTYYRDADGDTYGNDSDTRVACAAPTGYVARGGDCNDTTASARPGQTAYFATPITGAPAGREFDYDCDGLETPQYGAAILGCRTSIVFPNACMGEGGYFSTDGAPVACGASVEIVTSCERVGSECRGATQSRLQGCR